MWKLTAIKIQIDGDKDDKISLIYQFKNIIEEIDNDYFLSNFIVIADPIKSKVYERYTFASSLSSTHDDIIVPLENDQLYLDCKSFTNLIKDIYFGITLNKGIINLDKYTNIKKMFLILKFIDNII